MNVLKNLHSNEEGNEAVQTVAILGVGILLLIIFQGYGGEALDGVFDNVKELLGMTS